MEKSKNFGEKNPNQSLQLARNKTQKAGRNFRQLWLKKDLNFYNNWSRNNFVRLHLFFQ
jgi:hypothetical protein